MLGEVNRCPYCLTLMEQKPIEHRLTVPQYHLYRTVVDAGPEGISAEDLLGVCLPGRSKVRLRTAVYAVNQIINPMRLAGKGGRYYLDRVKWSEEKVE